MLVMLLDDACCQHEDIQMYQLKQSLRDDTYQLLQTSNIHLTSTTQQHLQTLSSDTEDQTTCYTHNASSSKALNIRSRWNDIVQTHNITIYW